jgi:hypothetical protein
MRPAGVVAAVLAVAGCQTPTVVVRTPPAEPRFAEVSAPPAVPLATLKARLDAAGCISSPFDRDAAIKQLVAEAAEQGDAADPAALAALVTDCLHKMNSPFDRDAAAGKGVRALARRGLTAEAVAVANTMNSPFDRDQALKAVVSGKP